MALPFLIGVLSQYSSDEDFSSLRYSPLLTFGCLLDLLDPLRVHSKTMWKAEILFSLPLDGLYLSSPVRLCDHGQLIREPDIVFLGAYARCSLPCLLETQTGYFFSLRISDIREPDYPNLMVGPCMIIQARHLHLQYRL